MPSLDNMYCTLVFIIIGIKIDIKTVKILTKMFHKSLS